MPRHPNLTLFACLREAGEASKIASSFSVLSIEGGEPGDDEWKQQFASIDDARGIELLSVNFGEVVDR